MRRVLYVAFVVMVAGLFEASAQDRSLEYQLAAQNNITFYSASAFDCKTPAAEQALADTQREIAQIQSLMDSLTTRVGFVTIKIKPKDLQGEDRAEYDAYSAILARLNSIAEALGKLPACPAATKSAAIFNPSFWIVGGGVFTQKPSSYSSTGAQAPFDGNSSFGKGQFGVGINVPVVPGVLGPGSALSVNVGVYSGGGDHELYAIGRHPPNLTGLVTLKEDDKAIIDVPAVLSFPFGALIPPPPPPPGYAAETSNPRVKKNPLAGANQAYAAGPPAPWIFSVGVGPSFRESKITMTSNQTGAGGSLLSASNSHWQTGFVVTTGLSHAICSNCLLGRPVSAGLEFRARWYPSQTVQVPSPFGFTETGHVGRNTDQSVLFKLAVPLFAP
jgi:hypothetical protein